MSVSVVVAVDEHDGIGLRNDLPWPRLAADMKWFRQVTMGNCLVMGRRTWESIGSKPLPGRTSVVVTRRRDFHADGATVVHSIEEGLERCDGSKEIMILGGGEIFRESLHLIDRIYRTRVHHTFEADTFFPPIDADDWLLVQKTVVDPDAVTPFPLTFEILERRTGTPS